MDGLLLFLTGVALGAYFSEEIHEKVPALDKGVNEDTA